MAILNKSHYIAVIQARKIMESIHKNNPTSQYSDIRKRHITKLREVGDFLIQLCTEPMFDKLQNVDTGGPVSLRKRLGVHLYALHEELSDGNSNAG